MMFNKIFPFSSPETVSLMSRVRFSLWREDTHGTSLIIGRFATREEAELTKDKLEEQVHKQHYWIIDELEPRSSSSAADKHPKLSVRLK